MNEQAKDRRGGGARFEEEENGRHRTPADRSPRYGFRFCVALFESFYYPIGFFILGSWYTRREIAKRIGLWFVAGPAGSAFSGYLQAAIYGNLNGLHGLAGWRWLYIICGIMTVPCGFLLYFLVPDFPENTKVWYLSQAEIELARERCRINSESRVPPAHCAASIFWCHPEFADPS
jgi:ACS family pantothenate transporter-like MFS transporter